MFSGFLAFLIGARSGFVLLLFQTVAELLSSTRCDSICYLYRALSLVFVVKPVTNQLAVLIECRGWRSRRAGCATKIEWILECAVCTHPGIFKCTNQILRKNLWMVKHVFDLAHCRTRDFIPKKCLPLQRRLLA